MYRLQNSIVGLVVPILVVPSKVSRDERDDEAEDEAEPEVGRWPEEGVQAIYIGPDPSRRNCRVYRHVAENEDRTDQDRAQHPPIP